MLIVFSGLPGTGKTTIARALAAQSAATWLRIDSIEQAIRDAGVLGGDAGKSGYSVANALAQANLSIGNTVIADCVNPVAESRQAWRKIADYHSVPLVDIEVVCSDIAEHRRRVETRELDIPGLVPATWQSVLDHDYEAWGFGPFRLDTAVLSAEEAVIAVLEHIRSQ
ncbi:AAA family ATPase [Pseudomonas fluorescens]|uniref:Kinase n=1 Tax=Pseudomonas fluorescens TaxID=294 RepID=A0A5E7EL04_PSEFL|nr:AAA family ATPase [Pseudomonas fluorescens]VVO27460.1 hypothetical protein PS723_04713 [Pseudomonas fluorescens]